jgi:hypothetical protein
VFYKIIAAYDKYHCNYFQIYTFENVHDNQLKMNQGNANSPIGLKCTSLTALILMCKHQVDFPSASKHLLIALVERKAVCA